MAGDLLILCYHSLSEDWPDDGALAPAVLGRQVRHLLGRGYRPLTLSEALAADPAERRLVVTFDDAFHSVLERGLPVLEELGAPATLFVPTDFVDAEAPLTWSRLRRWAGTPYEAELRSMSWEDVRAVADAGWEIGSHTCSHPDLTALDAAAAERELSLSKRACEERLARPCVSLAYPFGSHDERVVALASACGYEHAVTLGARLFGPLVGRPLELSRDGVYRTTRWPHFLAATAGVPRRLRRSKSPS